MVEYTAVNLVTFLVGVGFLATGYSLVRRGREDLALFALAATVGIGLIVVAVIPNVFQVVATVLGLELKARAILVISNLTLFVVATYLFNRIATLYDQVSQLNEELSLLKNTVEERGTPVEKPETAVEDGHRNADENGHENTAGARDRNAGEERRDE